MAGISTPLLRAITGAGVIAWTPLPERGTASGGLVAFVLAPSTAQGSHPGASAVLAGSQPERRGAMVGVVDAVDDAGVARAVLLAVGGVDLFERGLVGVHDGDVFLDASRVDPGLAAGASDAVPALIGFVGGADVQVVAGADGPDDGRAAQLAASADGRDLDLVG